MRITQAEARAEEARRCLDVSEQPVLFCIENQYGAIPVEIKGSIERGLKITPIPDKDGSSTQHSRETPTQSDGVLDEGSGSRHMHTSISNSRIHSLEISAYSKKTVPLIRYILTTALNIEMARCKPLHKISLVFTVCSSKRYLFGVVEGLNDLLRALSINTTYYLEEKGVPSPGGAEPSQTTIYNSHGETVYSVWSRPLGV